MSRIYGGIHWENSNKGGLEIGAYVLEKINWQCMNLHLVVKYKFFQIEGFTDHVLEINFDSKKLESNSMIYPTFFLALRNRDPGLFGHNKVLITLVSRRTRTFGCMHTTCSLTARTY